MNEDTSEKVRAWLLPAQRKQSLRPGLHLMATPIGNLGDITLRALDTLGAVDLIVCEDTRVTGKLLNHYGLSKKLIPYNDHNAARQRGLILEKLKKGGILALVSDAGTPLVSDPGYKLVQSCIDSGINVTALPGANAVLTALQLSGLPSDAFCFAGFLPATDSGRRKALRRWKDIPVPIIFYETAPRLLKTLKAAQDELGERRVAIARELTKMFEDVKRMKLSEAIDFYQVPPKGEIALVIGSSETESAKGIDVEEELIGALKTMSTKEAAAYVAEKTGRPRKELYELALKIGKNDKK